MTKFQHSGFAAVGLFALVVAGSAVTPQVASGQNGPPSAPGAVPQGVKVMETAKVAYDDLVSIFFEEGTNAGSANFAPVPPGKQLVVTYASAQAHLGVATSASFRILKSVEGGSTLASHELKPVPTFTVGGIVASEPLHIFVNPGQVLTAIVARNSLTGFSETTVTISGYLVDLQ